MMIFTGPAKRLGDEDLPRIGHMIGVGEDELHAFLDVETTGSGYDAKGRPKALFEPHLFHKYVRASKRAAAIQAGLAYPNWGERPYPKDSYPRILAAMALDEEAALKSTSWGIGQVLGANFVAAGYDSPKAMVQAYIDLGEAEQLESAVRFIKYNRLDDELRAHNWAAFARGYNGAGYARNGYHTKLAAAFDRWRRIRDTPRVPGNKPPIQTTLGEALRTPGITSATPDPDRIPPAAPSSPILAPAASAKSARLHPPPAAAATPVPPKPSFWARFVEALNRIGA